MCYNRCGYAVLVSRLKFTASRFFLTEAKTHFYWYCLLCPSWWFLCTACKYFDFSLELKFVIIALPTTEFSFNLRCTFSVSCFVRSILSYSRAPQICEATGCQSGGLLEKMKNGLLFKSSYLNSVLYHWRFTFLFSQLLSFSAQVRTRALRGICSHGVWWILEQDVQVQYTCFLIASSISLNFIYRISFISFGMWIQIGIWPWSYGLLESLWSYKVSTKL